MCFVCADQMHCKFATSRAVHLDLDCTPFSFSILGGQGSATGMRFWLRQLALLCFSGVQGKDAWDEEGKTPLHVFDCMMSAARSGVEEESASAFKYPIHFIHPDLYVWIVCRVRCRLSRLSARPATCSQTLRVSTRLKYTDLKVGRRNMSCVHL